jgi:hypothetical protein
MREGRFSDGVVAPALDMGRGSWEAGVGWSGTLRSESRGVEGLDSGFPSLPMKTQLSAVRNRFAILGRSERLLSIDSIDLTP